MHHTENDSNTFRNKLPPRISHQEGMFVTNQPQLTRMKRHKKRRNNNISIGFLLFLALLFFVILLFLIFSGNNNPRSPEEQATQQQEDTEVSEEERQQDDAENDATERESVAEDEFTSETEQHDIDLFQNVITKQVPVHDDNVIEAFEGNWPPIGTSQQEPHTTDYSNGSQDRLEIKRAVSLVTGIPEEDLLEHWVGNGGEQKVVATVSDKTKTNYFRVYLSWITNEGWQVTRVERIKEYTG